MDVEEAAVPGLHEGGGEEAHESGEEDEVHPPFLQKPKASPSKALRPRQGRAWASIPRLFARSRAKAEGLSETTRTTSPKGCPWGKAWRRASRFVPLPEAKTAIRALRPRGKGQTIYPSKASVVLLPVAHQTLEVHIGGVGELIKAHARLLYPRPSQALPPVGLKAPVISSWESPSFRRWSTQPAQASRVSLRAWRWASTSP